MVSTPTKKVHTSAIDGRKIDQRRHAIQAAWSQRERMRRAQLAKMRIPMFLLKISGVPRPTCSSCPAE